LLKIDVDFATIGSKTLPVGRVEYA
jgi:hypothetical protein